MPPAHPTGRRPGHGRLREAALAAFVAALVFVVLFWRLGAPTFWDPDEAHYAESSREMIATGDYWAPHYNGQPFLDKPALFHQLQAIAMRLVGPTELGARLVPALAALGIILVTLWFGRAAASSHVGLVAALLVAISPGMFALARYAILDTVFTLFTFGGAAVLAVSALRDRPRLQWGGYVLIGFGVATKGPLAIVLCGLTLLLAVAASADLRRRLLGLHWIAGLAIATAVSSPWFIYMYVRFRQQFIVGYFLDENVRLFSASRFANQPGIWFYFQILATGLLPWTGLVVGRLIDDVRAVVRGERLDSLEILLVSWTAAVVGFFTASTFKLDHYVFAAAPALCLLCARGWVDMWQNEHAVRHTATRAGGHLVGPLLVVMGVGCGYFLVARLELPRGAIVVPVVIAACGVLVTAFANVRGRLGLRPPRIPWGGVVALGITYAGLVLFVMPALEQHKVVPDVARWVTAHTDHERRVASFRLNRWNPAFRFYVDRPMTFLEDVPAAEAFFRSAQPFYCVMRRSAFDEFAGRGLPLQIVYEREGMWATSGRALWRRRAQPARFVVVTGR